MAENALTNKSKHSFVPVPIRGAMDIQHNGSLVVVTRFSRPIHGQIGQLGPRRFAPRYLILLAFGIACSASDCLGQEQKPTSKQLPPVPVILQGYHANRESFPILTCRFRFTETYAESVENAVQGKYSAPQVVHEAVWLVNGKKERYEVVCNPEIAKKLKLELGEGKENPQIPAGLDNYLTDGRYRIRGEKLIGIANFYGPGQEVSPPRNHLFTGLWMSFEDHLKTSLADPGYGKLNGIVQRGGRDLISVTFQAISPDLPVDTVFFDPTQGYLPLVHVLKFEKNSDYRYITKVKSFRDKRWFPLIVIEINHRPRADWIRVFRTEVTLLDASAPPPDSAFDFDLADYFQVLDKTRANTVFTPREGEKVQVGKMHLIAERLDEQEESRAKASSPEPAPERSSMRSIWMVATSITMIVVGVLLVIRYRRSQQNKALAGANGK